MNPLWELTKTRLREFAREKGAVFWVFGFPLLMAIGLGLAFRNKPPQHPAIAVVEDGAAPQLMQVVLNDERLDARALPAEEALRALRTGKVDVVVRLDGAEPKVRFDPTRDGSPAARDTLDDVLQEAAGRKNPLRISEEHVTETGARYIDFLLPGLIGLNLMGSSMWGVGYNLVVARKRRLLRRYAVTPMRRGHFLLSYFFSRGVFLIVELSVLVAFGALVFDAKVQGGLLNLFVMAVFGAASFAGISLLIGARVDNTESANGWMNFAQLPMWVVSGAFFSYERFPELLHPPIQMLPLTALVDGLRAIYNDGATILSCWPQLAVLGVWGAVGFFVSLRTFRWQ